MWAATILLSLAAALAAPVALAPVQAATPLTPEMEAVLRSCAEGEPPALGPVDSRSFVLRSSGSCHPLSKEKAVQLVDEMNNLRGGDLAPGTVDCLRLSIPAMVQTLIRGGDRQAVQTDLAAKKEESQIINILYATTRQATGDLIPSNYYSAGRSHLQYGKVRVSVPSRRQVGELPLPERSFWQGEQPDRREHFYMGAPEPFGGIKEFRDALLSWGERLNTKQALLFVHGYNNTFEDAILRAASWL